MMDRLMFGVMILLATSSSPLLADKARYVTGHEDYRQLVSKREKISLADKAYELNDKDKHVLRANQVMHWSRF